MAGKAIIRAFLILALIVTAHLIKPFSIKNVAQHLLYSTRSFRFVLPTQLREKFDYMNYLALNLSDGFFEADEGIRDFRRGMAADLAGGAIDLQPLDDGDKSTDKQRPCPQKSTTARRANRIGKRSAGRQALSDLVAIARADEINPVDLPPARMLGATVVPIVPPCPTRPFPSGITAATPIHSIGAALALRRMDCQKRGAIQTARIARIEDEMWSKGVIRIVEHSAAGKAGPGVLKCEEQEATAGEIETESKPDTFAPQTTEELRIIPLAAPFAKCSKDQ